MLAKSARVKWMIRLTLGTGGALAIATAGIGFLHTKYGRPYLSALARLGGCPIAAPDQVARARAAAIAKDRGTEAAPARPALGFDLDVATLADVTGWAKQNGLTCEEKQAGTELKCRNVPVTAMPSETALPHAGHDVFREVVFGFYGKTMRLQQVTTLRNQLSADEGSAYYGLSAQRLTATFGVPKVGRAEAPSSYLASHAYATVTMSYRYADYFATVTAVNVVGSGVVLREQYLSARTEQGG